MPLDDYVSTSAPISQSAANASPQKGMSKKKKGGKDEILVNPEFKDVVSEATEKHHVLAFGRMNPITSGHEALVNKVHDIAKEHSAGHTVVVSHSQDAKKNPLTSEQKVGHAKHAFPGTNVKAASKGTPTILHHAAELHKKGVEHLHVVAGSDRKEEMHNLLHKYNGQDSKHGHYNFKSITVHSSGARDPDSEGTSGISASKMREYAAAGNKKAFHAGAPSKMSKEHKDSMYNDTRKGMGLHESADLAERVISLQQRRKRAIQMSRLSPRLARARAISRMRSATPDQLKRRAYKTAKQNIRRRVAGSRGAEYQDLSAAAKLAVDVQIDPKVKNIKALVQRIMPRIRQADTKRLQAVRSHKQYRKGAIGMYNSTELDINDFNKLWEQFFDEEKTLKNTNPCWDGYKPVGTKKKNGKIVPNCVPEETDLNESFGSFYTATDLGIVAEGGFAMHPSVQGYLDENAADHLRQAAIMDRTGKHNKAAIHRKIASAMQKGDMTGAKLMQNQLNTVND